MLTVLVLVVVVVIVLFLGGFLLMYNRLIKLRTYTQEGWSQVDVQLTRRADLIPDLVATVQGYANYEKAVLNQITQLRTRTILPPNGPAERFVAEQRVSDAVPTMFAVAENYPNLKASENFLALQVELTGAEDRIAAARRIYNANVRDYNNACATVPSSIVASMFNFVPQEFFSAPEGARAVPNVSLR